MESADRRERYRQSFRSLFEVAKALSEDLSLEDLLRRIAREATRVVEARECSIMLFGEDGDRLLTAAAHGLSRREEERIFFRIGEGVAGWVAENRKTARIPDVRRDPRFHVSPDQDTEIRSLLVAPLLTKRGVSGVISVSHPSRAFDEDDEELLELLADAIVLDLEIVRLRHLAYRDPLTGAWSRQGMDTALEVAIRAARRDGKPVSVVLLDLDHFKRVNDESGHQFGDSVLQELVRRTQEVTRRHDQVYRYGGDEFLVLAPGAPARRARAIAERIRRSVAEKPFVSDATEREITVSAGIATLRRNDGANGASLVARADKELLGVKRARGRARADAAVATAG